jgi:hypothetical protein
MGLLHSRERGKHVLRNLTGIVVSRMGRLGAVAALIMTLFAGSLAVGGAPSAFAGQGATIVNDGVGLFAGIDDQTVIATMYAGDRVDVLWGPQNGLYQVRYYGTDGWTWAENLDLDAGGDLTGGADTSSTADTSNSGGGSGNAVVDASELSVRDDASMDSGIYEYFPDGTSVTVVGDEVNGFVPIAYGQGTAWVYAAYLDWDGSSSGGGVGGATSSIPNVTGNDTSDSGSSASANSGHWIDVNRNTGLVTLYAGDSVYAQYWGSLSYDPSDGGFYTTASGTYYVYSMFKPISYTTYGKAYIEDWVGFDPDRFNGFHSWSMDSKGNVLPNGGGFTGGCVGLPPDEAAALYDFAYIGMKVVIHD